MLVRASLVALIMLAACSSNSNSNTPDAAAATAMAVTCPATPAASIATDDNTNAFKPTTASISVGQIVKFTMSSTHNLVPDPPKATDAGLMVGLGATTCLMFTKAGTFNFKCGIHGFEGAVTVQ